MMIMMMMVVMGTTMMGATFDTMNSGGHLGNITQANSSRMSPFQTPTSNQFSFFNEGTSFHTPMRHENTSQDEQFQNITFQHPIQELHQNLEGNVDDSS